MEKSVSDGKVVLSTFDEEKNSIGVYVADAFLSYCASLKVVVPNPGIEVPKKNDLILLWDACQ